MVKFLLTIALKIGLISGVIGGFLFPPRYLFYVLYLFRRGYETGRSQRRFGSFGKKTLLAPDTVLLHPEKIFIGENSSVLSHCVLETQGLDCNHGIYIGNNVSIGEYCHITCKNKITISDGVLTGRYVLISDNGHGDSTIDSLDKEPLSRRIISKGEIHIGKNVWIGDKVSVLSGVKIGEGSIIGANSVVTSDVPDYSVVAGVPAKVIKQIERKKKP